MNIEIALEVKCGECNSYLDAVATDMMSGAYYAITVEPCSSCLEEARTEASLDLHIIEQLRMGLHMNKPTGYMAECPDCKNVVAVWSYDEKDSREEIGLMIGDWVMAGLTVKPIRGTSVTVQSHSCKDL